MRLAFTILGEPSSKANSRKLMMIGGKKSFIDGKATRVGGRPLFAKSEKARDYEETALQQIPADARLRLDVPVRLTARIYYASERPDLDASLIRDILQDRYRKDKSTGTRVLIQPGVYRNDRLVREEHLYHGIDKQNPRAEIVIETIEPQQSDLCA